MSTGHKNDETLPRALEKGARLAPPRARLCVAFPRPGRIMDLGPRRAIVGRSPDGAGIEIDDATVSRNHLSIRFDIDRMTHVVADLGSRNGSWHMGHALGPEEVALQDGDVVRAGDVVAVYERTDDLAADPSAVSREAIPGVSAASTRLRAEVAVAAADPSPVLLVGETGTGKEFIAREIHRLSGRRGAFVAVNCAALSRELVESQLFGHARGAFTGAQGAHEGFFRAADGGTLLLDEIGELPLEQQAKLLRVLQEGEVQPVGEARPVRVDVRVISATLRDLVELANSGRFRLDLYARLSPWEIRVPPLRARRADVLSWVERLFEGWHRRRDPTSRPVAPELGPDAAFRLLTSEWPSNLRGLDRVVHRACSGLGPLDVTEPEAVSLRPLPKRTDEAPPSIDGSRDSARRTRSPPPSKEELLAVFAANRNSIRATAKHYDRDRRQVYRWLERYGITFEEDG